MSNQQFAEPEWQSPQQRNVNTDLREQQMYNPRLYTIDPREKIQQRPSGGDHGCGLLWRWCW